MKDRSDDTSHHERTLLPGSYISLLGELKSSLLSYNLVWMCVSFYICMQRMGYLTDCMPPGVFIWWVNQCKLIPLLLARIRTLVVARIRTLVYRKVKLCFSQIPVFTQQICHKIIFIGMEKQIGK